MTSRGRMMIALENGGRDPGLESGAPDDVRRLVRRRVKERVY